MRSRESNTVDPNFMFSVIGFEMDPNDMFYGDDSPAWLTADDGGD